MNRVRAAVVVTAVLPTYREQFLLLLERVTDVRFLTGSVHCDATVRTGVDPRLYRQVENRFFLGRRLFLQRGAHGTAVRAPVVVVDLNPRSLTAWAVLLARRVLRRRTLVWGHLYPRSGPGSRTAGIRARMARLASGVVTYTWNEQQAVRTALGRDAWAATNALYTKAQLTSHPVGSVGSDLLYVGRLEPSKKLALVVRAFALALRRGDLPAQTRLVLVGEGSQRADLDTLVDRLGIRDRVRFAGAVYEFASISRCYASAAAAVSGGYAGLQVTQSLGFGVPVVLPTGEPHAPEIELAEDYCTYWFDKDSERSLAAAMAEVFRAPLSDADRDKAREVVLERYSADSMAEGFRAALAGERGSGW